MSYQIEKIFPTALLRINLGRPFSLEETNFAESLQTRENGKNRISVNTHVLENKELKDIGTFIKEHINNYVNNIINPSPMLNLEFYVTQSWFTYNAKGEFHDRHYHPNSIVSGVLYFTDSAQIVFHKEKHNQIIFGRYPTEYNLNEYAINAAIGDLIIFPSDLFHSVRPVSTDGIRTCLAFNTFVKGRLHNEHSLAELIL